MLSSASLPYLRQSRRPPESPGAGTSLGNAGHHSACLGNAGLYSVSLGNAGLHSVNLGNAGLHSASLGGVGPRSASHSPDSSSVNDLREERNSSDLRVVRNGNGLLLRIRKISGTTLGVPRQSRGFTIIN